ncbi:MAG: CDP-glycerol glycerophosphotransferase family protein [Desulfobacteraceae bacterium]
MYPEGAYCLTGFAKLDPLYNGEIPKLDLSTMGLDPVKKTLLYAPTFYPSSIEQFSSLFPGEFQEYNIIVKPHYFSLTKNKYKNQRKKFRQWQSYPNVYLADVDERSLLPFMATADILISEASSSIFEFAALDKPIVWCDFLHLRWSYKGPLSFRLTRRLDQYILKYSDLGAHVKKYSDLKKTVDEQALHPEMFSKKRRFCSDLFAGKSFIHCIIPGFGFAIDSISFYNSIIKFFEYRRPQRLPVRNENDGGLFPCQAKNQELRPLVLKQLDFLNAWQGKSLISFGSQCS